MTNEALQTLRSKTADAIDRLIAFLDMIDGYTMSELERNDGEPTDEEIMATGAWSGLLDDDEPSLGWLDDPIAVSDDDLHGLDLEHQCEDEGDMSDSGIGDPDGLLEQLTSYRPVGGMGAVGFASHVE